MKHVKNLFMIFLGMLQQKPDQKESRLKENL